MFQRDEAIGTMTVIALMWPSAGALSHTASSSPLVTNSTYALSAVSSMRTRARYRVPIHTVGEDKAEKQRANARVYFSAYTQMLIFAVPVDMLSAAVASTIGSAVMTDAQLERMNLDRVFGAPRDCHLYSHWRQHTPSWFVIISGNRRSAARHSKILSDVHPLAMDPQTLSSCLGCQKLTPAPLSTCDPLQGAKDRTKDVRRTPFATASVSAVLFETGSIDSFASSKALPSVPFRTSTGESTPPGPEGPITPTDAQTGPGPAMFDEPFVDSPCWSRANTMDEETVVFLHKLNIAVIPNCASSSTQSTSFTRGPESPASESKRIMHKKKPSPLAQIPLDVENVGAEKSPIVTGPATPKSAIARVLGAFVKSKRP
ncbi:hypothetical protein BD413DRAFT_493103 [Trametes elegans]|nr:hypothetical protein BD413DRAFT_493103 [Trametes elegans]